MDNTELHTPDRGAVSPTKTRIFRKTQKPKNPVLAGESSPEFVSAENFPWERKKKKRAFDWGCSCGKKIVFCGPSVPVIVMQ